MMQDSTFAAKAKVKRLLLLLAFLLMGPFGFVPIQAPPAIPFDDGLNWVLYDSLFYRILDTSRTITVPTGFVTDYASVPRMFWSVIGPHGPHSSPAVVHDFLYWDQGCNREEADRILALAMDEQGVAWATRKAIYIAVRVGGGGAWDTHTKEREDGLPAIIPPAYIHIPAKMSWDEYRQQLFNKGVHSTRVDPKTPKPDYCAVGAQRIDLDAELDKYLLQQKEQAH
jgi:hypothetical protein